MKKQFAIIGLGRFGVSVSTELYKLGHDVLAIDNNEEKLDDITNHSTYSAVADGTDEKELRNLGITNFDHVIVAIGDDLQASILCTLLLKEMDIPSVWVKAQNFHHHKVLDKIGADKIIHPEHDMGNRIAQHLVSDRVIDYIELSAEYSIIEITAPASMHKKTLAQLDIRAKYGVTVLGIRRGKDVNISPTAQDRLYREDILIAIGHNNDLRRFEETN
ncbi:TrkA family potassium uptake protein [Marinococcus halophilus]|uniref:Ktr system potassium uptake protein A n=1 Tax=Marinococcus halophilus TaxID=1371 RepID=A0A510Y3Y3_MARHA|nr:TrkA family potassium uptake protein [Marinococcus halophilus]OZT80045.1 TrkA family potassium uptake protein [Marinococcus halophilus]GEK58032.1 ktr system potassium uptake protein A [Marinococcus halophilus]